MSYSVTFGFTRAGRVRHGDAIEDWERPRFGFYWWYWIPSLMWNKGRFSRRECVDINVTWLCFSGSLTFWPS